MCTQRLSPKASSTAPAQNPYKLDDAHTVLDNKDRVYAGVSSENLFITGDANGYDKTDKNVFRIYLGSSIGDINISKDETRLIVSTYAGFVAMYDLTCREKSLHQIGIGTVKELKRLMFWRDLPPMRWQPAVMYARTPVLYLVIRRGSL